MTDSELDKEIAAMFHTNKTFICPVCFNGFDSRDEKCRHLLEEHGYEILDTTL